MVRLTREQSRAKTRERLIDMARVSFRKRGFAGTSLERLADDAGFTKGAVYAHFTSKNDLFIAALAAEGRATLDELYGRLDPATTLPTIVDALASWADDRARSGSWALPIIEYSRLPSIDQAALERQLTVFRASWREVGERLMARLPDVVLDPETLGALLHEIAHAPVMSLVSSPSAGDLMRLVLVPLFTARRDVASLDTLYRDQRNEA